MIQIFWIQPLTFSICSKYVRCNATFDGSIAKIELHACVIMRPQVYLILSQWRIILPSGACVICFFISFNELVQMIGWNNSRYFFSFIYSKVYEMNLNSIQ